MRWEIVKQAWEMAKKTFPSARIYVDLPPRFSAKGSCPVLDLEKNEPLGNIDYSIVGLGGKPTLVLQLGEQCKKASLDNVSLEVKTSVKELKPAKLGAKDVLGKCQDLRDVGQRVAILAAGHESSPLRGQDSIRRSTLIDWMSKEGFPKDSFPYAKASLKNMGIVVQDFNLRDAKRKNKPSFQEQDVVRVVDPNMRDEGKCGRVIQVARQGKDKQKDKNKGFAYLVRIDGASKESWFAEWQLAPNRAGSVPGVMPMGERQNA
jgi:hypothetical protein